MSGITTHRSWNNGGQPQSCAACEVRAVSVFGLEGAFKDIPGVKNQSFFDGIRDGVPPVAGKNRPVSGMKSNVI